VGPDALGGRTPQDPATVGVAASVPSTRSVGLFSFGQARGEHEAMDTTQIDKAIAAHGAWKTRLKTVVDTGTSDTPVATISKDDQCAFGQWLYGPTLSAEEKASQHYAAVKGLHAEFHKIAAQVAGAALSGKGPEALAMIDRGGEYARVSGDLTRAMMDWKKSLA
jgi:chemoreceptor zinc-binding protein